MVVLVDVIDAVPNEVTNVSGKSLIELTVYTPTETVTEALVYRLMDTFEIVGFVELPTVNR